MRNSIRVYHVIKAVVCGSIYVAKAEKEDSKFYYGLAGAFVLAIVTTFTMVY